MTHKPRLIAMLATPGVQLLDVAGPLDVFAEANVQAGRALYEPRVVATRAGELRSSSGVRLAPDSVLGRGDDQRFDTLLVAGSPHAEQERFAPTTLDWLRRHARIALRYGSVCSGAFMLAAAGLLERRRVTTHWAVAERLASEYPATQVDVDAIFVRDGKLRTAAGVTAGLDMALALVEEDHGHELATAVAAQLVMFFRRPGGQLSFSRHGEAVPAGRSALQEVQRWVAAHPAEDHSVTALSARMHLSPRHFARLFRSEVGMTPAAWVEASRIATARRLLEGELAAPKQVAALCGFADADTLRRAFRRHVGITPAEYRKRYTG
jgi:transcriptional regulator GlxA family with amidase domain